jgi:molybdate transport system substrate-binding protein
MRRLTTAVVLLALASAPAGSARAAPRRLAVAAAASVKPALDRIASAFEAAHPGTEIRVTAGASGAFHAQIRGGAPFDVFFSADREYPAALVAAGLGGPEVVYAIGSLVVWTPPGSPIDLAGEGLAALSRPGVGRIAIANPAVAPYGRAALAALEASGVLARVKDRLVLGQSVAQAARFAQSGAADAAVLPRALALAPALAGGSVLDVPQGTHPPLEHSALVLKGARDPALAREFLAFVTGAVGRDLLARAGYAAPAGGGDR